MSTTCSQQEGSSKKRGQYGSLLQAAPLGKHIAYKNSWLLKCQEPPNEAVFGETLHHTSVPEPNKESNAMKGNNSREDMVARNTKTNITSGDN